MNDSDKRWLEDKAAHGWTMPPAPKWKRLWGVRHIRAVRLMWLVMENEYFWGQLGLVPNQFDRWVVYGIRRGWERGNE